MNGKQTGKNIRRDFTSLRIILAVIAVAAVLAVLFWPGDEPGHEQTPLQGYLGQAAHGPAADPEETSPPAPPPNPEAAADAREAAAESLHEDPVVSLAFVDAVADYIIDHYRPAHSGPEPKQSPSLATGFRSANAHFGQTLPGLNFQGADPEAGRAEVLRYLVKPATIKAVFALYAKHLAEELAQRGLTAEKTFTLSGGMREKRPMSKAEVAAMLHLLAELCRRTGQGFAALSESPAAMEELERYKQAAAEVEDANAAVQGALGQDKAAVARTGENLKAAIARREQHKKAVPDILARTCGGDCPAEGQLFSMAMWTARRPDDGTRAPTLAAAAQGLQDLAGQLKAKAAALQENP